MMSKKSHISFDETNQFSKLFLDYINGDEKLKHFYSYLPTIDSFKNCITERNKEEIHREVLVNVINKQYQNSQLAVPNTKILLDKNTFTVCTGHQLCIFTGPLYFIYKIITTINLAEELRTQYPNNNFVPIYWMASEDHDFEEIRSIHLFGKKIEWDNPNASGAVGALETDSLNNVIDQLKNVLGESL